MRVWVGNLGKYNEGILVGEWISLEDINNYEDAMTNDEVNINNDKDEPDICD